MKNIIPDSVSEKDNVFDVLMERGFIEQCTHEEEIRDLLSKEKIKFYIGFDPTADCLHVGHFMQVIIMMYMQKYGHTPVVLLGGGTGMVGDPSGRTDMRQVMDELFGDAMAQVKDMLVHVGFEPEEDGDCSYPLCRFLREQKKYQALFFSDSLRSEVMDAIYNSGKDHFLVNMRKRVDTSDEILLSLFYFQLNGCLALARKNVDCSNAKWDEIQCSVDRFLTHGLSALGAVDPMNG